MRPALWLCPVFALALGAQDADPKYMGVQARLNYPIGDLKEASGPVGLGLSIFLEHQLEDGYAVRLVGGMDVMGKGLGGGLTGDDRARVFHFDVEGIKFFRPDEDPNLLGPYLVAGVGAYGWELTRGGNSTRTVRWGGSVGFGYRMSTSVDAEIRGHYSSPESGFNAASISVGLGYRF